MTDPINNGNRPPGVPGLTPGSAGKAGGSSRQESAGERPAPAENRPAGDEAALSNRLQAVRQQIEATPEVNRERVDALKERIANGEYPVDAERIASRMVELENLLNN